MFNYANIILVCLVIIVSVIYYQCSNQSNNLDDRGAVMAASTDPCSLSNPHEVVVTHWHLVAAPDFDTKKLTAHLTLNVTAVIDQPPSLVLDTRDLTILSVTDGKNGQPLKYKLLDSYQKCPAYGTPLVIDLPATERGSGQSVVVSYETSPNSSAIQWLDPLQTAGKVHPYLFTQCQAIHCRSLLPCQDTPSVKSTYTAEINVPKELTALMSAVRQGDSVSETNPQLKVYKFKQAVMIISYCC
jgi:leukotriene-A4 hydrolase